VKGEKGLELGSPRRIFSSIINKNAINPLEILSKKAGPPAPPPGFQPCAPTKCVM